MCFADGKNNLTILPAQIKEKTRKYMHCSKNQARLHISYTAKEYTNTVISYLVGKNGNRNEIDSLQFYVWLCYKLGIEQNQFLKRSKNFILPLRNHDYILMLIFGFNLP